MFGKFAQSSIRPIALGTTVNSSVYGATICVGYGRYRQGLYLTWEANIRTAGSKIKSKITSKKSGVQNYVANVDFLIGTNPILTPLQFWMNQNQKLPLNFFAYTFGVFTAINQTVTLPDLYAVLAMTYSPAIPGSATFDDYGSLGPVTFSNIGAVPLWNAAYRGPDPSWPAIMRQGQYYYWVPSMGNHAMFNNNLDGNCTVYYAVLDPNGSNQYSKKQSNTAVPSAALNLTFEPIMGDGPEYTGNDNKSGVALSTEQILYPSYAGLGSPAFTLGVSAMPEVACEVLGMYNVNPGVNSSTAAVTSSDGGGDADFADMIEDIFKQGIMQPGFPTDSDPLNIQSINSFQIQHSLGCYDLPGIVNAGVGWNFPERFNFTVPFFLPNQAGNFLIVVGTAGLLGAGYATFPGGISDTAGDTWTAVIPPGYNGGMWVAQSVGWSSPPQAELNSVVVAGIGNTCLINTMEINGVDTQDNVAYTVGQQSCSVTTTNAPGFPACIIAFCDYGPQTLGTSITAYSAPVPGWKGITPGAVAGNNSYFIYVKTVYNPGTYTFTAPNNPTTFPTPICIGLAAFKLTQPSPYPRPLTDILDTTTMDLTRNQCRAYGLWGSLVMDSQQKASDWLDVIYKAANSAPVWSGFKLKSIPYSEQSYAGNGAVYTSPTSTGPIAPIPLGDFIHSEDQPLYSIERKAQVDVPNVLQMQCPIRSNDYNDVIISQPMTAAVALFGSRKDSPQQFRCVTNTSTARMILNIQNNRRNNLRNTYKFTLVAKWKLLEPMDLITLPADPLTGLTSIDVRITKVQETAKYELEFEAEQFVFGTNAPITGLAVTSNQPYQPLGGVQVPAVNAPIIFEPVPRLLNQQNQGQIWLVVSAPGGQISAATPGTNAGVDYVVGDTLTVVQTGASGGTLTVTSVSSGGGITGLEVDTPGILYTVANNLSVTGGSGTGAEIDITAVGANYAGCTVYLSTDGGNSYNSQPGSIVGNAIMGVTTNLWPAANDPDTTNNLSVNLTQSNGTLLSYQTQDEDDFNYPCYVSGGSGIVPYELMTYAVATLTSPYNYTLMATGSGHHLRRAVFGAPTVGAGVSHSTGANFAFLGNPGTQTVSGIYKLDLDPRWIGVELYFKFVGFDSLGSTTQTLSGATAYSYTPTGVAQQENPNTTYVNTPAVALSRTATTTISLVSVTVQFPSNTVQYNARTFTIPTPSVATTYYVTIADPRFLGEEIGVNSLTATCQTSNALVGVVGNTYMGAIQVSPSGITSDLDLPGGWPAPFVAIVN